MKNTDLKGIFSALLVSFDENGNINEQGTREIIRHNIDKMKIDGLYVGGSTGENFMLSTAEKKEIFRIVRDEVKNDIRIIAQVGSVNVKEAVELAQYVTELGYDAISAVTPFYYKFSFPEIKEYYNTIVNSCNNRMIIYSIPLLTNVNMSVAQFGELFENENIIGVKFTAADFFLLERTRRAFPDKLIWAGFDEMMLPAVSLNVDGAIGSTFNVNGIQARQIFNLAQEGKFSEALELQHIANDLIEAMLNNGLYSTLKNILKEQGVHAGYCRRPMGSSTPEQRATAKELYQKYLA